jgi:hypothetical protein
MNVMPANCVDPEGAEGRMKKGNLPEDIYIPSARATPPFVSPQGGEFRRQAPPGRLLSRVEGGCGLDSPVVKG